MRSLTPELLSDVIGGIYDAAHDPATWPLVIAKTRDLFHGSRACFARIGPDLGPHDAVNDVNDAFFQNKFIEEHAGHYNIYEDKLSEAPLRLVYHDHALIGGEALKQSRFWNDWMAPQDMYGGLGVKIMATQDSFWLFDVQRGRNQPSFDADEIALLKLLVPHLTRVAGISRKTSPLSGTFAGFSHFSFGVVMVDSSRQIVSMNEAAETMLVRSGSPLRMRQGHISVAIAERAAELQRLIEDACSIRHGVIPGHGGDMVFPAAGHPDGVSQLLTVLPMTDHSGPHFLRQRYATVLLRELTSSVPDNFDQQLRVLFDLSPTEARLAAALSSGLALKEAAAQQDIRVSTARSYLESIFRKTGVRQQSQLVALLKSAHPLIGHKVINDG